MQINTGFTKKDKIIINILLGIVAVSIILAGLLALNRAIDRHALATCHQFNDCEAVMATIK